MNIYYLLCYAWNCLDEGRELEVGAEDSTDLINLFARVLVTGVSHLLRRGLDRGYVTSVEPINGIKGKLLLTESLKHNLLTLGKSACAFDDFSYDVLHNQIINETLFLLLQFQELSDENHQKIRALIYRLPQISRREVSLADFRQVHLHRNNAHYRFLLNICELIWSSIMPSEQDDKYLFSDFIRDEKKMAVLFEQFVRNFYKLERPDLKPCRTDIMWKLKAITPGSEALLPKMQTDVTLSYPDKTVIIDTKYYVDALVKRADFDSEKLKASNMYQMHAYITNLDSVDLKKPVEGILLYPQVDRCLKEEFQSPDGGKISFRTIDLNVPWRGVREGLLGIV